MARRESTIDSESWLSNRIQRGRQRLVSLEFAHINLFGLALGLGILGGCFPLAEL